MTRLEFCIKGRPQLEKPYRFKECGLDNVYLLNGVTIEDDPDYGRTVSIDRLEELHLAIGLAIVSKPGSLKGGEFRFLRKEIGQTQADLARRLRVSPQTIANYEKGRTANAGAAEVTLKMFYLVYHAPDKATVDSLISMLQAEIELKRKSKPKSDAAAPRRFGVTKWSEAGHAACM